MTDVLTPNAKQPVMTKAERHKVWVAANREWKRAYDRAYRQKNIEKFREKDRRQYAAHAEKKRRKAREYAKAKPHIRRQYMGYPEPTRPMPLTCECCGTAQGLKNFHLDHCHVTGRFRGWLCARCNLGIGYFKDSIERLELAVAYLNRSCA